MDARQLKRWSIHLDELGERIVGLFARRDLHARAKAYLSGLLGRVERKNSWQLAEHVGAATRHGTVSNVCWAGRVGMPMRCGTSFAVILRSTSWPRVKPVC